MTTTTRTVHHDKRDPECGLPAVAYLLIAYPKRAVVRVLLNRRDDPWALDEARTQLARLGGRLRGEFVCPRHGDAARVFVRPPFGRIVTDIRL